MLRVALKCCRRKGKNNYENVSTQIIARCDIRDSHHFYNDDEISAARIRAIICVLTLADSLMYEAKRHRNAWAGMLTPSDAATSFDFDHESIEPTSMLFRAKRAGQLVVHGADAEGHGASKNVSVAG